MLRLVESQDEKLESQRELTGLLKRSWRTRERRWVVWRPASELLTINHDSQKWFCSVPPGGSQAVKRYWNSFGEYSPRGTLNITLEINIPTVSNSRRVSGFFAKDLVAGTTYLMHDGSVGGGRPGIGRDAFLAWSSEQIVPVVDSNGSTRDGLIVAPLVAGRVAQMVGRFVDRVAAFKAAVRDGQLATVAGEVDTSYGGYKPEFSGRKRGERARLFEYISRHGDIVDALARMQTLSHGEQLLKNCFIDLGIGTRSRLRMLYEVKTSADRQSLYAGLGQLMVHGRHAGTLRHLVVPQEGRIPDDVVQALQKYGIKLLRFNLEGGAVRITS